MSDNTLAFLPDGQGYFQYANAGWYRKEYFRWAMADDGTLTISGTTSEEMERGESVIEGPGLLHIDGLKYRVEPENTPRGEVMDVLTLDGGVRWQYSLEWTGLVPEKYARIRPRLDRHDPWPDPVRE